MDKIIHDNHVAVLYSPSYGSGWYTAHYVQQLLFDPVIVEKILSVQDRAPWDTVPVHMQQEIIQYCQEKYPDANVTMAMGVDCLQVEWIPIGAEFRVDEYDGNETVVTKNQYAWITA